MAQTVREFILQTTELFYGISNSKILTKGEDALNEFVHNSHTLLLQSFTDDGHTVMLLNKVQMRKSLIFYKPSPQELTSNEVIKNINLITLSNSAAQSLYQIISQIYAPLLSTGNDLFSNKIEKNLSDLESNLRILTYGKNDSISVILSIEDEIEYWKVLKNKRDGNKKEKEAASNFSEMFEEIHEEIGSMRSGPMSDVREAAENIGGLLDDVWRYTLVPYSQDRMIHIIDVIGHVICSIIQNLCSTISIWEVHIGKDNEVLTHLCESLKVVQTWTSACKSLTATYWPNYALHPWSGKTYVPMFCANLETRLKEISDIRSTFNQLNKLLTNSERQELMIDKLFLPFQDINVWIYNGPNHAWDTAVSTFSSNLRPAEAKIAEKMKPRLHNTSTKQMLYEFMRYKTLIVRPLVKQALSNELEIFVSSLQSMLRSIQSQLDANEVSVDMHQPSEMSPLVLQVQWAKQMEAKVKEIHTCAESYLKEFDVSSELSNLAAQVLKDLKTMYTQLHEEWSRDLQAQVKSGSLQLSTDKPVVEFSTTSRLMVVNFNPRLTWLENEARALAALGLQPPNVASTLDQLSNALQYARGLHQVASFHNTLGERMIPSTRPMMLQAALDLSSLVQNQKAVYWNDTEQLHNFTEKLKKIVLKLETQNTYLTTKHLSIRNMVEKLMDTDLLAKQADWKKGIKDIRDIIEKVETDGYKSTELWRTHWDWQIYKALECQYVKTLLSLHKYFPHVKVDLVLRGHTVRCQPPIEDIRVQHYHQLRRLVALPAQFVSLHSAVTDQGSIFARIVDKHSWLGNKAVKQLEAALSSLERTCISWSGRAALACVPDLEALCTEHLKEPHDWEVNFKACKAYGQAVAKMSFDDEKIDWISVGTATLRREFEAQTRSLWACLMTSLQSNCRNDASEVDAFMANAMIVLDNKVLPKNAKELAEISAKQQAIQAKMPEMEKTIEALRKKGHMLRTWGGDSSVDATVKEWQKICQIMHSQQQIFEHQAEIVKSSLTGDWENLNSVVEAWSSRWSQNRSRLESTQGVHFTEMVDRCRSVLQATTQWDTYVRDRDEMLKECEKFNMKFDVPELWQHTDNLMKEYLEMWTPFKDYSEEYETISEQEWIVFQKKLHLLDEFETKWSGRLEPYTTITLYLRQELDKLCDLPIMLKYVRGADFTERHWRDVFSLLQMEYKKPETLQVKDFLIVALNIKKQIKALQKICSSAASESAVRSALNELELWFAGARFNIAYYNDKAKRPTPIVKDFKDMIAKIEEQQWVVSSLGGDVSGAGWANKIRGARALAKAASHAQRRSDIILPLTMPTF